MLDEEYDIEDGGAYPQATSNASTLLPEDKIDWAHINKSLEEVCKKLAEEKKWKQAQK